MSALPSKHRIYVGKLISWMLDKRIAILNNSQVIFNVSPCQDYSERNWNFRPSRYYVWSGTVYTYVLSGITAIGIDTIGESQLVGHPLDFPLCLW